MESSSHNGFDAATCTYTTTYPSSPSLPDDAALSLPDFLLSPLPSPPSKPAFVDAVTGHTLTYSALRDLTLSAAHSLRSLGLARGDIVLFLSPNSLHFPALSLAILSLGAVFSPANFLHTRSELALQVHDSDPALIMTTAELKHKVDGLGRSNDNIVLIEHFLASLAPNANKPVQQQVRQSDVAALMYSSGTTGKSKGVACTHKNLISMTAALQHVWRGSSSAIPQVYLCTVPLFHMFGFSVFVCGAVAAGATVVVVKKYSLEEVLMAVEEYAVTRMPAVPPMVVQMARSPEVVAGYDVRSLKEVICSGAPLAREHMESFSQSYPGIALSQCYGLTETSGPVTLCDGVFFKGKKNYHLSIGRLIPLVEAKIVDVRTGRPLPPNKYGELYVRGPPIMQGYLKNPEATALAIDGQGWLRTGDLCYIDQRGLVYVVDRIKELIKYKAYQVAPAELEEVLSTHPDIRDVAVTAYPDEEAGEVPMACVVRKDRNHHKLLQEEDIISFMENKVAPYKKIRKVVFVEFIPRSPSGKILRRHLKASSSSLTTSSPQQRQEIPARL